MLIVKNYLNLNFFKKRCDKSNPFIKFNEDDYSLLSTNEIESAMSAVTTSFNAKPKRKSSKAHLSSLEPIKDLSTDDINSNCSQSLISFEQHELTQCTPMSDQFKTQSNSTPMSRLNDFSNATNEFKNYFNSLQSTSVINDESELVSDYLCQEKSCSYCCLFYSNREFDNCYFIDLNGHKISDENRLKFDLQNSYKIFLTKKNSLTLNMNNNSIFVVEIFILKIKIIIFTF